MAVSRQTPLTAAGQGIPSPGPAPLLHAAINQVEYSNAPDGPIIHVFGRDPGGRLLRFDITGFLPYFYVPDDQAGPKAHDARITIEPGTRYTSIRGEPLRRLYTRRPSDVRELRVIPAVADAGMAGP